MEEDPEKEKKKSEFLFRIDVVVVTLIEKRRKIAERTLPTTVT